MSEGIGRSTALAGEKNVKGVDEQSKLKNQLVDLHVCIATGNLILNVSPFFKQNVSAVLIILLTILRTTRISS